MFLEKNKNIFLLSKKVHNKKISTALQGASANQDDVSTLTRKELEYLTKTPAYVIFSRQVFSQEKLSGIVYEALLQMNIRAFSELMNIGSPSDDFALRFIYESNKTEGSRIPLDQVTKIIQKKKYIYKVKNEIQEVQNSLLAWDFLQKDFKFTLTHIKRLYHILTKDLLQENGAKYPRGFKKVPVVVNNQNTVPPERVEDELKQLISTYQMHKNTIFPLQAAFDFHLRFEQIHPFENGNGRIGRLIMNKILLAAGFPPCIIFAENRQAYFAAIATAMNHNHKKYYQFMLDQYEKTLKQNT